MSLDPDICYRALLTRDARFDGRFFTAVRSTGVYCRPICPARIPKRENCLFLPCAAAAQEAGFRPCLRCRPETSPGTPAWLGTSATVSRALRLIDDGALDKGSLDALAERLGIGERHLRRLFVDQLGAPPLAVAQTRRVLFAKQLIDGTRLSMTEVAHAAGFASVRRFNAAIRTTYRRTPTELRGARNSVKGRDAGIPLRLGFRVPFDWPLLLDFLGLRAIPGVERVDGNRYVRSISIDGHDAWVSVERPEGTAHLLARVHDAGPTGLIQIAERLRRVFDLGADPAEIGAQLGRDPSLRRAVHKRPGVRVPGAWEPFELAVRAILGQQISVKGARTLAGRLVAAHGRVIDGAPEGVTHVFPEPAVIARADLTQIGVVGARARAISGLAGALARGELTLESSHGLDETVKNLCALPGIGEWTAQYIAMRAFGEPDAFPTGDLGLRKALANGRGTPTNREMAARAEKWRPWRAYAAILLWTEE